jgi:hypothetical protein
MMCVISLSMFACIDTEADAGCPSARRTRYEDLTRLLAPFSLPSFSSHVLLVSLRRPSLSLPVPRTTGICTFLS